MRFTPPEICPVCGEEVRRNARACPECGADEKSGWKMDGSTHDGLDLPDEDFDYELFVATEFGGGRRKSSAQLVWAAVALTLLICMAAVLASKFL